jgi:radical SAM protein with 4Fe4S-binding SPASM domain
VYSSNFERIAGEATKKAVPLEVILELTSRCNLRCAHCYLPAHGDDRPLATVRLLEVLDELASMGTLFLTLTGGEPLLRPDWQEIVRRARTQGFHVTLLTNGSLVDDEAAALLGALGVVAEVSFYSRDPEVFDGISGVAGSHAAVRRGVELLRRHGVRVTLKVPVMSANAGSVGDVRAFAEEIGAECIAYPTLFPRRDGDPAPLALGLEPAALVEHLRETPDAPSILAEPQADRDEWPLCAAGTRSATIAANGDVLACPMLPQVAGTVRTSSFREVWEGSELLRRLRALRWHDVATCGACDRVAYCGRCPAQALLEDGDVLGPSRSACAYAAALETARGRSR